MKLKLLAVTLASTIALTFSANVLAQKVIKVGSTPTGIPFTFLDTKTNTIQGAMVDVINAVGKEAGLTIQIEAMPFSTLIASLTSNRIDLISAAMFITPARQEVVAFSAPIYRYGEGLMLSTKLPERTYASLEDLKGLTVGVQIGTAFVEPLKKIPGIKEVKLYDGSQNMISDLNAGRIQAGLLDYPIAAYILSQGNNPNVRLDKSYKPQILGSIGIAANKDNPELLATVNAALTKLQANGTIDTILKKWGLGG
jgi:polar amino acid transport system substrate-binding protein